MDYSSKFIVKPGSTVKLNKIDPDHTAGFKNKNEALEILAANQKKLAELQYELYAENKQSLLIVLQALDAGGKDGTINHVLAPMNPQGCRVHGFKAPTAEELAHDFLWRIHLHAPKNGEVVIFNRSHYEDVLIARVHNLVSRKVWSQRYNFINGFEKLLACNNTKIIKFFLYISKEEQLKRFESRLDEKDKHWKISEGDYSERQYWDGYIEAFEETRLFHSFFFGSKPVVTTSGSGAPPSIATASRKPRPLTSGYVGSKRTRNVASPPVVT